MGSKKHKKHHKSEKRDVSFEGERQEKPLKLVLKVAGSSIQAPPPPDLVPPPPPLQQVASTASECSMKPPPALLQEQKPSTASEKEKSSSHSHEKHKKSKKKKKKKSSEKDKDRHDKKRKHHRHHHHHREHSHDRKEKRKREQQELSRSVIESHEDANILQKTSMIDAQVPVPMEKPLIRGPRTCTLKKKTLKSPLQIMLCYILKKLQMKDPQDFFAWPVTDTIAPGYSDIIKNPIDFSTIKKKIDDREYGTVTDFKSDIKLMCDNAMTYNGPDTIYYKSARRMWHAAQKIMSRDQLISLKQTLPYLSELTEKELGIDVSNQAEVSLPKTELSAEPSANLLPEAKKTKVAPSWGNMDIDGADDDELSPEDILAVAQKAAKAAAEKLTLKRPNSTLGFLRQQENGTTTLNIIHPKAGDYPQSVRVNLQMLTGKLSEGTGTIVGFNEDPKNIVKPVTYTNYGAYHSYAPHYDSMFANLSKEDSDLLLSTYGDETAVQYADSIMTYSKDSDYILTMVDNLLDVLTGGEHSKTVKIIEERRKMREEEQQAKNTEIAALPSEQKNNLQSSAEKAEAESIQALNDIDMEMSMLETPDSESSNKRKADKANKNELLQKHKKLLTQRKAIQQKLDNATQLLQDLRRVQNERLSAPPPSHLSLVPNASPIETDLADRFTKKIADIASQLPPESVANVDGLRKAMGITSSQMKPLPDLPLPQNVANITAASTNDRSKTKVMVSDKVNSAVQSTSPFEPSSPAQIPNERHVSTTELDSDLQQFLETGPMLRVCDSPTGS